MSNSRRNNHAAFITKFSNSLLAKTLLRLEIQNKLNSVDSFDTNALLKFAMGLTVIYGDAVNKSFTYLTFRNQYVNDRGNIKNELNLLNILNGAFHLPISAVLTITSVPVVLTSAVIGLVVEAGKAIQNSAAKRADKKTKLAGEKQQTRFNSSTTMIDNVMNFQRSEQPAQEEAVHAADEKTEAVIYAQAANDHEVPVEKAVFSSMRKG